MILKRFGFKVLNRFPYNAKRQAFQIWSYLSPMGRISNRGERWVVSSWNELLETKEYYHILHAFRYYWLAPLVKDACLLDLGCGSGYGTWYLSRFAREAVGLDVSIKAIAWATEHFKNHNLTYAQEDVFQFLAQTPKIYDAITAIELLEHFSSDEQKNFLEQISCLKPQLFLLCIPNSNPDSLRIMELKEVKRYGKDPFHKGELTSERLTSLLNKYLPSYNIEILGQHLKGVRTFQDWRTQYKRVIIVDDFEMKKFDYSCTNILVVCRRQE